MYERLSPAVILTLGLVLAACGQDRGTSAGAAGALGGFERAERGCTRQAEDNGLVVEGIQFTQSNAAGRGRITGAETILIVSREGRTYPMRCRFTYRTGEARLTSV